MRCLDCDGYHHRDDDCARSVRVVVLADDGYTAELWARELRLAWGDWVHITRRHELLHFAVSAPVLVCGRIEERRWLVDLAGYATARGHTVIHPASFGELARIRSASSVFSTGDEAS